jgi:hypothetical protein
MLTLYSRGGGISSGFAKTLPIRESNLPVPATGFAKSWRQAILAVVGRSDKMASVA